MIYLTNFFLSYCLILFGQYLIKHKKKKIGILICILSMIILSAFASMRSINVGTDVQTYVVPDLKMALSTRDIVQYYSRTDLEPLFGLIIFISSRFTNDPGLALFLIEFLCLLPIFITAYKLQDSISISLTMLMYYFLFFNLSLSAMRQSIAAGFLLLAFTDYFINEKISISTIALFIISFLFHNTAILAIILIFLLQKATQGKVRESFKKEFILLGLMLAFVLFANRIVEFVFRVFPFLPYKYYRRIFERTGTFNAFDELYKIILVSLPTLLSIRSKNKDKVFEKFVFICVSGCILQFLSLFSEYLIRISIYFLLPIPFILAFIPRYFKNTNGSRMVISFFCFLLTFFYWFIIYYLWRWYHTVPFIFR